MFEVHDRMKMRPNPLAIPCVSRIKGTTSRRISQSYGVSFIAMAAAVTWALSLDDSAT